MVETYALELIEKGRRIDGRKFDEYRQIEIRKNVVEKAEGSALVKFGETEVIAGVKMEIGTPFPDSPNDGILIVSAEFTPLASPDFESGPPGEDAIELARIVDRAIRESKCIELNKLVIEPEKKVWSVFIDIHIINHEGNLLDASALASIVALLNTKIPRLEEDKILRGEYERNLPVIFKPMIVTVCKVGKNLILDPTLEEENILDTKLSIAIRDDEKICTLQKQGTQGLNTDEIEKMIDLAIVKTKEIRKLVK